MGIFKPCAGFRFVPATYPLLPVGVLQFVEVAVVPADADTQQGPREEAILSQNHKICEKTTKSLDHPWKQHLQVSECV